jgi:hypothetical protein
VNVAGVVAIAESERYAVDRFGIALFGERPKDTILSGNEIGPVGVVESLLVYGRKGPDLVGQLKLSSSSFLDQRRQRCFDFDPLLSKADRRPDHRRQSSRGRTSR